MADIRKNMNGTIQGNFVNIDGDRLTERFNINARYWYIESEKYQYRANSLTLVMNYWKHSGDITNIITVGSVG